MWARKLVGILEGGDGAKRGRDFVPAGLMVTGVGVGGLKARTEHLHQKPGRAWQPHRSWKNMEEKSEVNYLHR